MSQTLPTNATEARGFVTEHDDERMVLTLPDSDYQIHLLTPTPVQPGNMGRIAGVIHAKAKRVDKTKGGRGGRYFEPVYGRPRRVQGRIVSVDAGANTITVNAACAITCELSGGQKTNEFAVGEFVTFDVEAGSTFTQTG